MLQFFVFRLRDASQSSILLSVLSSLVVLIITPLSLLSLLLGAASASKIITVWSSLEVGPTLQVILSTYREVTEGIAYLLVEMWSGIQVPHWIQDYIALHLACIGMLSRWLVSHGYGLDWSNRTHFWLFIVLAPLGVLWKAYDLFFVVGWTRGRVYSHVAFVISVLSLPVAAGLLLYWNHLDAIASIQQR